jgi:hypothetical protein
VTGRMVHQTAPHGEHTIEMLDDGDGQGHYRIYGVEDSQGRAVAFTDEELDSIVRWWAAENPRVLASLR